MVRQTYISLLARHVCVVHSKVYVIFHGNVLLHHLYQESVEWEVPLPMFLSSVEKMIVRM